MKKTLQQMMDEQGITATTCKEQATPKRAWAHQHTIDKDRSHITDAALEADPKSMQEYDCVDKKELIEQFCDSIVDKLETRGIIVSSHYVSTFITESLHDKDNVEEAARKKVERAQRAADKAEFNQHLAKLSARDAAILLLHIKHKYAFPIIGRLVGYSKSQVENLFHIAENTFDSEESAPVLFDSGVTLDTAEEDLTGILIQHEREHRAGRPTKEAARAMAAARRALAARAGGLAAAATRAAGAPSGLWELM